MNSSELLSFFKHDPRTTGIADILLSKADHTSLTPPLLQERGQGGEVLIQESLPADKAGGSGGEVLFEERGPGGRVHLKGLIGSARSLVAGAVYDSTPFLHFFILSDKEIAAYFYNDLEQIFDEKERDTTGKQILFFPSSFRHSSSAGHEDNQGLLSRTEVLNRLYSFKEKFIIVSYPEAIAEKVVNRKFLEKNTLKLKVDESVSHEFILDLLLEYEFKRADFVIEPGQFSLRGGLIDVYSFSNDHPYRIEFEGDKVASIRTFDPASQLSLERKTEITIIPDIRINQGRRMEYDSLFAFLPENTVIWTDDIGFTADILDNQGTSDDFLKGKEFFKLLDNFSVVEFGKKSYFKTGKQILYNNSPQPSFNKNFDLLIDDLQKNTKNGFRTILLSDNPKQSERLFTIIEDIQQKKGIDQSIEFTSLHYSLHEGFVEKDLKLVCYTDHQIFERYHRFRLRDGYSGKESLTLKEIYDLKPGDYVTHIDHGIGRFDGLEKIVNNGREQEAIRLIYKNNDILYVSIHSLHRISKYNGKEGTIPTLNRLGSDVWNKLKNRTKSRVKDIAKDLIRLYAQRKAVHGIAYSPDTYLQTELEASFIYEDTPDQLKATVDVKKDLEQEYPMDRLICGDVGFGKTEIAIRAAFKVVAESKQVALLVPTTILALQHNKTFSDRLKDFPCTVNYINRFKSAKVQKQILSDLENGKIDILIGTHRLLSKDIKFKDLGLLIIDEEQKFGVAAKEKIKQIKINVDTLTLTATPIPRTLQFSLMGARDLSIINTPPPNRYPVQTEIHAFSEEIIRDAINFEISRGGQVFFVNARIQNIIEVAGMVQRMVPKATIAIAHGQMEGSKLEKVMVDFIEGEYDVLISTTIIESGLDIPNVNTIIINEAHHYGLSDLHQLRGRVGRSNKKAFCWLLSPPLSSLNDESRKRLKAIEEFSDIGSGFNIAMRDLDIRGAGNILGGEQSGFISEIGFEMYHRILDEAILELKEQEFKDIFREVHVKEFIKECQIETDLEVLFPDYYITNITERLNLYKELDSIDNETDLTNFSTRLADRFGPIPPPSLSLINTLRLRRLAKRIGFEKLVLRNNRFTSYFPANPDSPYYQSPQFGSILQFIQENPDYCKLKEERNKLFMIFQDVTGIEQALDKLNKLPVQA